MQSKTKLFFIPIVVMCVFFIVGAALCPVETEKAYAEEIFESGYDLKGDYDVKITYSFCVKYVNGIRESYEVVFDRDFFATVEDKKALIMETKDTFVKNGFEVEADQINGRMKAEKDYDTTVDYYKAIGIDGYYVDSEKDVPTKKSFYFLTYQQTRATIFMTLKTEGRFINRIYKACASAGIGDDKMLLHYVYGTPYNEKMVTSTADSVSYSSSEKMYYHTFNVPMDNLDKEYTITRRVPNQVGWYVTAIIGGIIVLAIPLSIAIKKNREKKNGAKSNQ